MERQRQSWDADAALCEQPRLQPRLCQVTADGGRVLLGGSWAAATDSTVSAAPRGEHPAPLRSDSIRLDGVCNAGWSGAGKGNAAPGCEGNINLGPKTKKSGGGRGSEGTGSAPCSAFCYLYLITQLTNLNANPSLPLSSTAEKGHFDLL